MLRAIALSMLVLLGVAFMLPFDDSLAVGTHSAASHRLHRHSRAWWRRHRARLRMRRAAAIRRRNALLAASAAPNANASNGDLWSNTTVMPGTSLARVGAYSNPRGLFNLRVPDGWSRQAVAPNGGMSFRVYANNQITGQAMLSIIPSNLPVDTKRDDSGAFGRRSSRLLGGIAYADLRRLVINKMFATGGWVVNDLERQIGSRKSFVVLAHTPASSDGRTPEQSWTFYFTEAGNRVYSLATSTLPQYSNQLTAQSEQLLASFQLNASAALASAPGH